MLRTLFTNLISRGRKSIHNLVSSKKAILLIPNSLILFLVIFILTMIITGCYGSFIEITPINEGHGFITLKTDKVEMIESYRPFLHVVNTSQYKVIHKSLENSISTFPGDVPSSIQYLLNNVKSELQIFNFNHRNRRGLLNIVGKGIKFITGNLDDDDLKEITEKLNVLEENEENVIDFDNKLINFSTNLNDQLKSMTDHINNETVYLNDLSKRLSNTVHDLEEKLKQKIILDSISLSIQMLLNHIVTVKQAIAFTKIGLLSSSLLDPTELANIDITHYRFIKTGLFHNDQHSLLYFVIQIPTFTQDEFYDIIIEPVPNQHGAEIVKSINSPLITCNNSIYIKGNHLSTLQIPTDKCLANILHSPAECLFTKPQQSQVIQIAENVIVTKNLIRSTLYHNCSQLSNITISGNNLIRIINCSISINNVSFNSVIDKFFDHILLPVIDDYVIHSTEPVLTMELLHNKDLETVKEIHLIKYKHKVVFISFSSTIAIIFVILAGFLYYNRSKDNNTIVTIRQEANAKEGGVTPNNPIRRNPFA